MFKVGDKVQFIDDEKLGYYSGKKGYIERVLDKDEILIEEDEIKGMKVYEVWLPLRGNVEALEYLLRPVNE
jgi:hypothetical protein